MHSSQARCPYLQLPQGVFRAALSQRGPVGGGNPPSDVSSATRVHQETQPLSRLLTRDPSMLLSALLSAPALEGDSGVCFMKQWQA